MKRKSALQYEVLEKFYLEQKYPTLKEMEDCAAALGLTLKEVRGWFCEKRRRDKSKNGTFLPPRLSKKLLVSYEKNATRPASAKKISKQRDPSSNRIKCTTSSSTYGRKVSKRIVKKKKRMVILQELLAPDYILKKIFRKDGPPLGVEFDSLPSMPFDCGKGYRKSLPALQDSQRVAKRRKISNHTDVNGETAPPKKHGIGKGLMTVWRATNPDGGDFPCDIDQLTCAPKISNTVRQKPLVRKKRPNQLVSKMKQRMLAKKLQEKRKFSIKKREVQSKKNENLKLPHREKCMLSVEGVLSQEHHNLYAMLVDDEELELREMQGGPKPLSCSDNCSSKGLHGCSLCKDLLPKFPPNTVTMKQPFGTQPWDSSPETVKKLFKVFHFLYTYSVTVDICSFTLDEFAQAFHDKDSLLLGKIHIALIKLLLSDVETEVRSGILPHSSISCKFLALLHSVENQEFVLNFWKKSLNSLTWTEILRQVLVSAGFGSKIGALQREALNKEMDLILKYGLRHGTLKGELFRLLSEQGSNGLKVAELAKSFQIAKLNLASTTEELEGLICSTLSSDITLFEKISSSAYRLRSNCKEADDFQSDTDSGSVDYLTNDAATCSGSDDSECDSENSSARKLNRLKRHRSKSNTLTVYNEIDESNPGEVWLLGLMEGEYSGLSIEEMLNALVALVDLLSSGPSIRMEDPTKTIAEYAPKTHHHGSGAKIKRSSGNQHNLPRPSWVYDGQLRSAEEANTTIEVRPVDSSSSMSMTLSCEILSSSGKHAKEGDAGDPHPMQSIFLGSDRRYNRYWLFLGPCNSYDPGHRRVYFESSEDGHWEVIDTEEALRALLSVLDDRGRREAVLIESLEKREAFLCQEMSNRMIAASRIMHSAQHDQSELDMIREESSSPVSDVDNLSLSETTKDSTTLSGAIVLEVGKKGEEQMCKWSRLQELDAWIWNDFYTGLNAVKYSKKSYLDSLARCEKCNDLYWRDEKHCKICHTTFELDFDLEERFAIHSATCRKKEDDNVFPKYKILPSHLQSLKAAVHAIESVMPEDALLGAWSKSAHRLWVKRLRRTSSLAELLQVVADFVAAINEDWLYECNDVQSCNNVMEEIIACFPNMPQTSSAVALWLVKLDSLIAPYLEKEVHSQRQPEIRTRCSGRHAPKQ